MVAQIMEDDGSTLGDVGLFELKDITFEEIRKTKKEPYLQFKIRDKMELIDLDVCFKGMNKVTHYERAYKKWDNLLRGQGYKRYPVSLREDIYCIGIKVE